MTPETMSVVIPTIGRAGLLRTCLDSLLACDPVPDEVLVVDQGSDDAVSALCAKFGDRGVRRLPSQPSGIARGINVGLREAANDWVLVTNDDCTVAGDWIRAASHHLRESPDSIITGRVLAAGDPDATPALTTRRTPHDFVGTPKFTALFGANMALDRRLGLEIGGFDERDTLRVAAEENDFCYRWMKAGRSVLFRPDMVVWHHDWRSRPELTRRYVDYARGQGAFYAKHLRGGDLAMLRFIAHDYKRGIKGLIARLRGERYPWEDERQGVLRGLAPGFLAGWLESGRIKRR